MSVEEVAAVAVGDGAELAVLVLFPQAASKASILITMKKNKASVVGFLAFMFVFILLSFLKGVVINCTKSPAMYWHIRMQVTPPARLCNFFYSKRGNDAHLMVKLLVT